MPLNTEAEKMYIAAFFEAAEELYKENIEIHYGKKAPDANLLAQALDVVNGVVGVAGNVAPIVGGAVGAGISTLIGFIKVGVQKHQVKKISDAIAYLLYTSAASRKMLFEVIAEECAVVFSGFLNDYLAQITDNPWLIRDYARHVVRYMFEAFEKKSVQDLDIPLVEKFIYCAVMGPFLCPRPFRSNITLAEFNFVDSSGRTKRKKITVEGPTHSYFQRMDGKGCYYHDKKVNYLDDALPEGSNGSLQLKYSIALLPPSMEDSIDEASTHKRLNFLAASSRYPPSISPVPLNKLPYFYASRQLLMQYAKLCQSQSADEKISFIEYCSRETGREIGNPYLEVKLSGDLSDLNLEGTNLSGVFFWRTDLSRVKFSSANLANSTFFGAILEGADFTSSFCPGARFLACYGRNAIFNAVRLNNAKIRCCDFRMAYFGNIAGIYDSEESAFSTDNPLYCSPHPIVRHVPVLPDTPPTETMRGALVLCRPQIFSVDGRNTYSPPLRVKLSSHFNKRKGGLFSSPLRINLDLPASPSTPPRSVMPWDSVTYQLHEGAKFYNGTLGQVIGYALVFLRLAESRMNVFLLKEIFTALFNKLKSGNKKEFTDFFGLNDKRSRNCSVDEAMEFFVARIIEKLIIQGVPVRGLQVRDVIVFFQHSHSTSELLLQTQQADSEICLRENESCKKQVVFELVKILFARASAHQSEIVDSTERDFTSFSEKIADARLALEQYGILLLRAHQQFLSFIQHGLLVTESANRVVFHESAQFSIATVMSESTGEFNSPKKSPVKSPNSIAREEYENLSSTVGKRDERALRKASQALWLSFQVLLNFLRLHRGVIGSDSLISDLEKAFDKFNTARNKNWYEFDAFQATSSAVEEVMLADVEVSTPVQGDSSADRSEDVLEPRVLMFGSPGSPCSPK